MEETTKELMLKAIHTSDLEFQTKHDEGVKKCSDIAFNLAISFAQFILNDFEMSSKMIDNEEYPCFELAGTSQKYTAEELFEIFKNQYQL